VRDLGGHRTADGRTTRFGAVVRADSVRQLTAAGWDALVSYGVRTIVDLRVTSERQADPPHPPDVEVVHIPLGGELASEEWAAVDAAWRAHRDVTASVRHAYLVITERFRPGIARAVSVVGRSPEGGVLVHCFAGKDRAGLVCALLLRLVDVTREDVAADYGLSADNLAPTLDPWIASAADEEERSLRHRMGSSPSQAMVDVLSALEHDHGSVADYLLEGGASAADLERVRARLVGKPAVG
jgi:protein tyrosine/serine phosphatase